MTYLFILMLLGQNISLGQEDSRCRCDAERVENRWREPVFLGDILMPGRLDSSGYSLGFDRFFVGSNITDRFSLPSRYYIEIGGYSYFINFSSSTTYIFGLVANLLLTPYFKATYDVTDTQHVGIYASLGMDYAAFWGGRWGSHAYAWINIRYTILESIIAWRYVGANQGNLPDEEDGFVYPKPWLWVFDAGVSHALDSGAHHELWLGVRLAAGSPPEGIPELGLDIDDDGTIDSLEFGVLRVGYRYRFSPHARFDVYANLFMKLSVDYKEEDVPRATTYLYPFKGADVALFLLVPELVYPPVFLPNMSLTYEW